MSFFDRKEVILFQGDSVTDCGRNRDDNGSLGNGYPLLIAGALSAAMTDSDLTFINKGISGNRVSDLIARWDEDCIALKPTVVSILIGINNTWRRYDENDPTSTEKFVEGYRTILSRTAAEINAKIIIMEPFVLPVNEERCSWREDLDPKIQAVRALAREYNTLYIPLDGIFASACSKKSPEFWAGDGVHPTIAGHGLIAREWIKAIR